MTGITRVRRVGSTGCLCATLGLAALASLAADVRADGLPNGRVYEMVSPPDKNGGQVFGAEPAALDVFTGRTIKTTRDGTGVAFALSTAVPGARAAPAVNTVVARRNQAGWSNEPVAAPTPAVVPRYFDQTYLFSPDLSFTTFGSSQLLTSGAPSGLGMSNLFRRDPDGSLRLLTVNSPVDRPSSLYFPYVVGASPDMSRVIFEAPASLTPDTLGVSSVAGNLYQWEDGRVTALAVLPDGTVAQGSSAGADLGMAFNYPGPSASRGTVLNAVSEDASHVFFGAPLAAGTFSVANRLYVRIDSETTQELTHPEPGGDAPGYPAYFGGAAKDGSVAYFMTASRLTPDATPDTSGASSGDLYRYVVGSGGQGSLTDITVTSDPINPNGAAVTRVIGTSADGEYVYFDANGKLTADAVPGTPNVYVWHRGTTRLVVAGAPLGFAMSADGRRFAYSSDTDPSGASTPDASGVARFEVYLYDAVSGQAPLCVSCGRAGSLANGNAYLDGSLLGSSAAGSDYLSRNLTDDGHRVFFSSRDALLPGMRVDDGSPRKVYQYEWSEQIGDGRVSMISSPTATTSDLFLDASANGDDVFIVTAAPLSSRDTDTSNDVYDARVSGGFPADAVREPCSPLVNCRPPKPEQAVDEGPGSSLISGAGNDTSIPAPRGRTPRLRVSVLTAQQRAAIARTGRLNIKVRTSTAVRLTLRVRARLAGNAQAIGFVARNSRGSGVVSLSARLARPAREALSSGRSLRLAVTITSFPGSRSYRAMITAPGSASRWGRHHDHRRDADRKANAKGRP